MAMVMQYFLINYIILSKIKRCNGYPLNMQMLYVCIV